MNHCSTNHIIPSREMLMFHTKEGRRERGRINEHHGQGEANQSTARRIMGTDKAAFKSQLCYLLLLASSGAGSKSRLSLGVLVCKMVQSPVPSGAAYRKNTERIWSRPSILSLNNDRCRWFPRLLAQEHSNSAGRESWDLNSCILIHLLFLRECSRDENISI